MITNNKSKLVTLIKSCVCAAVVVMAMNVCEARVYIGIGVGGSYPYSSCVPGYWDNGFWIEGNCGDEDYYPVYSEPAFIWGGFGDHEHHHEHNEWHGGGGRHHH